MDMSTPQSSSVGYKTIDVGRYSNKGILTWFGGLDTVCGWEIQIMYSVQCHAFNPPYLVGYHNSGS